MTRWSPDAALRLEEAALLLFERQGFSGTTVPQIAQSAGLTTRTFFRHFVDKRDVLFLRDREFPDVVGAALTGAPENLTGIELVKAGLLNAAVELEAWREPILTRQKIIASDEQLRERELLKREHLAEAVGKALRHRGINAGDCDLLAHTGTVIFDLSLKRWLCAPDSPSLPQVMTMAWADLERILEGP